ncbi:MAG TPA: hypothetical protein PLW24_21025, partial [Burkholderiaceae bacterium]|nr:hypothetical protein [Burkholderiaceae bacterium]
REGLGAETIALGLATAAAAAQQALGQRPYDSQLIAARAVLEGRLAEMATGEGKTLTVALAAAVGALAGQPVHAITANDYLVERDAERLRPLYAALGLTVGCVVQADERPARALAYRCDVTYVTAKELVFDYLRDGQASQVGTAGQDQSAGRVLRGLCMAIVDEADAILLDEARVPLILSQPADMSDALRHARQALRFAQALEVGLHFELDAAALAARLTERGRDRLARATSSADADGRAEYADLSPVWRNRLHREHAVCTALAALHLYQRDRHYLVRDGRIQLIDETTGRIAEGRAWSNGLQQLVELKEGVVPSPEFATVAQITYQRFFPRYFRLGGLSGTLGDARAELLARYGLSVRRVPLRRPCRRRVAPTRLLPDHPSLWVAVARRVQMLHRRGRPVLVATDSVAEAQALADHLQRAGLPHVVLHARCDAEEAAVVARAGQRGAITVATNMAGRGTDIALGEGVAALGGLHVLSCQLNPARRIDRQLAGRAARQGDPGSVETWLSLDTGLIARSLPARWRAALAPYTRRLPPACVIALLRLPQWLEERRQCEQRERLTRHDEQMERRLAFAGRSE